MKNSKSIFVRSQKDGGLAWLVCFGAFITKFLETGMVKSLGVLLPALREQFTTHTWVVGLVISLSPGLGSATCILAAVLNKRFSPRFILITFSLLSSIGLLLCSFATSVGMLTISVILTGFNVGAEAITLSLLPDYFDKYYDISNGIAHAGFSVGIMVMPLVTQFLLDVYGWRGTILLLCGLNLHLLVCAALFGPINESQTKKQYGVDNPQTHAQSTTIPTDTNSFEHTAFNIKHVKTIIVHTLDLHLFKNLKFLSLLCLYIATGYYYIGWLIYVVPHGVQLGFQPYQASTIATVGGIGNLVGVIIFPLAAKLLSGKALIYLSTFISSVALAIHPILSAFHSYIGFALASSVINFGSGVFTCAVYKELLVVVEEGRFPNAVNWMFVFYSVGSICSGFLSGWLFDRFGNYTASFLFLGCVPLISLSPALILDIRNYIEGKRYSPVPVTDPVDDE